MFDLLKSDLDPVSYMSTNGVSLGQDFLFVSGGRALIGNLFDNSHAVWCHVYHRLHLNLIH